MEKYKKIVLPILAGIGYECLSLLWIVVAVTFTFPGTSFGSWDLKEDVLFIPIGIIMLLLYVLTLGVIVFKMRKKGKELALFILAAILTAGVVFGIRGMEKTEQPASKDTTISDNEKMTTQDAGDEELLEIPMEENGILGISTQDGYVITEDIMVAPVLPEEILEGTPSHYYRYKVEDWVFEWLISEYVGEIFLLEEAVLVISKEDGDYETQIIHAAAEGGAGEPRVEAKHTFKYMDVNFDEVPDLLICTGHHGIQGFVTYYCFLQTDNGFVETPTFTEICNPSIDRENELILSQWRNHAASHSWAKYEYKDGTYSLTEELREDIEIVEDTDIWYWTVNDVEIGRSDKLTEEERYELLYGKSSEWQIADDKWRTIYNNGLTVDYSIYNEPE